MSDLVDKINALSPKRLALLALDLHERLEAAEKRGREAIAIIGMACRFPGGADDPEKFWSLLSEGRDAIAETPRDRWNIDDYYHPDPDAPSGISTRNGGFLSDVGGFDAAFFGVSPREALTMDPQQRLLLETVWAALENAGVAADKLAQSATGVFVGICNSDHFQRALRRGCEAIDGYVASGNAMSVAAGRISYCLGLQGAALSIDTACSSSLVALHVACRSLRSGESRIALCGGVSVMCSPETTIALSKAHMLAPDGRCKTFDAAADGFSRGEGCGVLVLKRLDDAIADRDRVLAVIRGAAVNHDGRSGGLTVPNGPAQEAVIAAALADAGLSPRYVDYVEAHGTGTKLGDPIEVRALAGAYGVGRDLGRPLLIGSVKTNIGHLESAAGIAGVIKVVLALQNERIPPHLHFQTPSPHIAWADYPVEVTAEGRPWPRGVEPRRAGVSSFGFSGTNAHVVIEEAPAAPAEAAPERPTVSLLPLSARSPEALAALAGAYADLLDAAPDEAAFADVAHAAGVGRSHLSERVAIVGDAATARAALRELAGGHAHPAAQRATVNPRQAQEVVFLFAGQGSQYPGMARELYRCSATFRGVIDRCDALLGTDAKGRGLKSTMWDMGGDPARALVHETVWTQPALFAVEYGIAQVWRSFGVEPAAVVGHSIGEYVAACVAGVFTLEDGLALVAERGRLMQSLPPGGAMAAIFAPADTVAAAVAPMSDRLAVAALNAADSVVVSGAADAVDALVAEFEKRNVQGHRLHISFAAHSPLVAPALDALEACASRIAMAPPRIPVAWNLTGGLTAAGGTPDARYWRRHLREPVRFADGIAALHADGYRTFLDVGPHPTLAALAQRTLPADGVRLLASLRRGKDDWAEMYASLGALYVGGANIAWGQVGARVRVAALPTYPFQRRHFWIPPSDQGAARRSSAPGAGPLSGARLSTATPIFETLLKPDSPAYLRDHMVRGAVLVAGPVMIEMALAGARQAYPGGDHAAADIAIREALTLPDEGRIVQTAFGAADARGKPFAIHSRAQGADDAWTLHMEGRIVPAQEAPAHATATLVSLQARLGPSEGCEAYYAKLGDLGVDFGPAFRTLREAHRGEGEALARVCGDGVAAPALMDGALQTVGLATTRDEDLHLLVGLEAVSVRTPLPIEFWAHARLRHAAGTTDIVADIALSDAAGGTLGALMGVRLRRAPPGLDAHRADDAPGPYYRIEWEAAPPAVDAARALRPPSSFRSELARGFETLANEHGLEIYETLLPALDRLCGLHAAAAVAELGFDWAAGREFDAASERARLRVAPRHALLFQRMLDMLSEDGALGRTPRGYVVAQRPAHIDFEAEYASLEARFSTVAGEYRMLRRCGAALWRVLAGTQDPLQLLFPDGGFAEARELYVNSPYAKTYNGALAQALRAICENSPASARLRILEIGAGTGGTTRYVVPTLPSGRFDYTFTDLSPLFLDRAAEDFANVREMRRAILDIERDPATQGFIPGAYDVVIAANVLHAAADLRQTLQNARSLLAPGGVLLLLEGVRPERWVDLTFGMTEGWWRFSDSMLRPHHPLIDRKTWRELLEETGFSDCAIVPGLDDRSRAAAQQALIVARLPQTPRRFAVVGETKGLGAALAARLRARGDQASLSEAGAVQPLGGAELVYLGAASLADRAASDGSALAQSERLAVQIPLRLLQELAKDSGASRAVLVTRGAASAPGAGAPGARWQAPLHGLGRVFALEHPTRWRALVDLDPAATVEVAAEHLMAALDGVDREDQIAWREGARLAPRLTPAQPPRAEPATFRPDATYLVTGGGGGLGLVVARWMAERGARRIALMGRRPIPDSDAIRGIEALGARTMRLACDIADPAALAASLRALAAEGPPLAGVMHAAADISGASFAELAPDAASRMLRPKLAGTLALEQAVGDATLDFLVLFSSTTALFGASGLAHYAAANAFLDATAHAPHPAFRRVVAINWGTWAEMRLASTDHRASFREAGLEPMAAEVALDALGRLLASDVAQAAVAAIDWSVLKPMHEARRPRPFLARLSAARADQARPQAASVSGLLDELANALPDMRREILTGFVRRQVAIVLRRASDDPIPVDTGLFDLGMDSLMSVELKRRLESGCAQALPSTLTFNYPNIAALSGYLESALNQSHNPERAAAAAVPEAPASPEDLDELSEDELEARLMSRLEQVK